MALVSHQHGFIYLKTEKTGGTSVEMALQTAVHAARHRGEPLRPGHRVGRWASWARAATSTPRPTRPAGRATCRRSRWRGSSGAGCWSRYLKVASLRNPFDKAVSWYWFMARQARAGPDRPGRGFPRFPARERGAGLFPQPQGHRLAGHPYRQAADHRPVYPARIPRGRFRRAVCAAGDRRGHARRAQGEGQDPQARSARRRPTYFDAPTAEIVRRNWGWIFEAGGYSLDPADAGRASQGGEAPGARAGDGGAGRAARASEGGLAATVKRLLTRRAG